MKFYYFTGLTKIVEGFIVFIFDLFLFLCAVCVQSPMELSLIAYTKGKGWFEFSQNIELDDSWSYFYLVLHIRKGCLKLDGLQG